MIPKQVAPGGQIKAMAAYGVVVNVGDMVSRLGDRSISSAEHWPLSSTSLATQISFCQSFVGIAETYYDPKFSKDDAKLVSVSVKAGWNVETVGEIEEGDKLTPTLIDGKLSSTVLEKSEIESAPFVAVEVVGENLWKVRSA